MRKPKTDTNTVRCPHCRAENPRPAPGPGTRSLVCDACGLAFELKFCPVCGKWQNEDHYMCTFRAKGAAVGGDCKVRGPRKHYQDMQRASVKARRRKKAKPDVQAQAEQDAIMDIAEGL